MNTYNSFKIGLFLLLMVPALFGAKSVCARELFGYEVSDSLLRAVTQEQIAQKKLLSPILSPSTTQSITNSEIFREYDNRAFDFLLMLSLVAYLAVFRNYNRNYFSNLFKAFFNNTLSSHQLKDPIESNASANLGMNIFTCLSIATYLFYVIKYLNGAHIFNAHTPYIVLLSAVLVLILIFALRLSSLKFAGWAFGIETATAEYVYNIFLINKILSVVLLPFTLILAWGSGGLVRSAFVISLVIVGISMLNRITRSGDAMRSFIRYSKFHFFLYLCASEIFPVAIIGKIIYQWLAQ